jgi:hypothetical protein
MFEDRINTIETINRVDISKTLLAQAVNRPPQRITDFVKGRPVPEADSAKIKDAVRKIEFIYSVFAPFRILFDSPELLEAAHESAEITKQARETAAAQFQLDTATAEATEAIQQLAQL